MSDNHTILLQFARENENLITTTQANDLLAHNYYHNGAHYVAEILARMVKIGKLKRVKRGVYEIGGGYIKQVNQIESEQQLPLL